MRVPLWLTLVCFFAALSKTEETLVSFGQVHDFSYSTLLQTLQDPETYVFIDFYVDWCDHCQKLSPIFESASRQYQFARLDSDEEFPNVVFAKVNCDNNKGLCEQFSIKSYPIVKLLIPQQIPLKGSIPSWRSRLSYYFNYLNIKPSNHSYRAIDYEGYHHDQQLLYFVQRMVNPSLPPDLKSKELQGIWKAKEFGPENNFATRWFNTLARQIPQFPNDAPLPLGFYGKIPDISFVLFTNQDISGYHFNGDSNWKESNKPPKFLSSFVSAAQLLDSDRSLFFYTTKDTSILNVKKLNGFIAPPGLKSLTLAIKKKLSKNEPCMVMFWDDTPSIYPPNSVTESNIDHWDLNNLLNWIHLRRFGLIPEFGKYSISVLQETKLPASFDAHALPVMTRNDPVISTSTPHYQRQVLFSILLAAESIDGGEFHRKTDSVAHRLLTVLRRSSRQLLENYQPHLGIFPAYLQDQSFNDNFLDPKYYPTLTSPGKLANMIPFDEFGRKIFRLNSELEGAPIYPLFTWFDGSETPEYISQFGVDFVTHNEMIDKLEYLEQRNQIEEFQQTDSLGDYIQSTILETPTLIAIDLQNSLFWTLPVEKHNQLIDSLYSGNSSHAVFLFNQFYAAVLDHSYRPSGLGLFGGLYGGAMKFTREIEAGNYPVQLYIVWFLWILSIILLGFSICVCCFKLCLDSGESDERIKTKPTGQAMFSEADLVSGSVSGSTSKTVKSSSSSKTLKASSSSKKKKNKKLS